jgi:hypothetical protein
MLKHPNLSGTQVFPLAPIPGAVGQSLKSPLAFVYTARSLGPFPRACTVSPSPRAQGISPLLEICLWRILPFLWRPLYSLPLAPTGSARGSLLRAACPGPRLRHAHPGQREDGDDCGRP